MAQFHETVMGQKFYTADVPRLLKTLERIAAALESSGTDKALEKIAAEVAEVARTARADGDDDGDDPVSVAQYRERQDAEENECECECDNTHDQNDTVCRYCWAKGRRRPSDPTPEKKCGENICCDDPNCAERENKAEAISIAKQSYGSDDVEIDEDAEVDLVFDGPEHDLQVSGAWVAARVFVGFTANKGGK